MFQIFSSAAVVNSALRLNINIDCYIFVDPALNFILCVTHFDHLIKCPCADPESFVRGGPTFFPFFKLWHFLLLFLVQEEERGTKYHHKRAIISSPAKCHLNGISLECQWWPNIECRLGSFVIFQGIWTSIAKKPYIFGDFSCGGRDRLFPPPPPWIRAWCRS